MSLRLTAFYRSDRLRFEVYAQQIGRGTRLHPGKDHLLILDFLWLSHRHDIVHPAALIAGDEEEAQRLTRDGDLLDNVEKARADKLAKLARELEATRLRKARDFDLLEFAVAVGNAELANFAPVMRWHHDAVTVPQLQALKHHGFNPSDIRTKGQADVILSKIRERRQRTPRLPQPNLHHRDWARRARLLYRQR
jgi:hypothetical protein